MGGCSMGWERGQTPRSQRDLGLSSELVLSHVVLSLSQGLWASFTSSVNENSEDSIVDATYMSWSFFQMLAAACGFEAIIPPKDLGPACPHLTVICILVLILSSFLAS